MPLPVLLLLVVLIGVVAVVAASRARGLYPPAGAAAHDRAPLRLPAPEEPIRAEDLERVRFSLAFRGYRMDEVDAVMDRLAAELAARDERLAELAERGEVPDAPAETSDGPG